MREIEKLYVLPRMWMKYGYVAKPRAQLQAQPSPTTIGAVECCLFAELQTSNEGRVEISKLIERSEWRCKDFVRAVRVLREWGLPVFMLTGSVLYRGDVEIPSSCPSERRR